MDDQELEGNAALEVEWLLSTERERWGLVAEGRVPPSVRERILDYTLGLMFLEREALMAQAEERMRMNAAIVENLRVRRS